MSALSRLGIVSEQSLFEEFTIKIQDTSYTIKSKQYIPSQYIKNIITSADFDPKIPITINKPYVSTDFMNFFIEYMAMSQKGEPVINVQDQLYSIASIFPYELTILFGKYFVRHRRTVYNTVDENYDYTISRIRDFLIAAHHIDAKHLSEILAKLFSQCIRYKPLDKLSMSFARIHQREQKSDG